MKIAEIQQIAKENSLETILWQKCELTKICFNSYIKGGYRIC